MYGFPGNCTILRGQVTISHGANIAANVTQDTTVALASAVVGDQVKVSPAANPAAGVLVGEGATVSTAGVITIRVANVTTATVAAGTAVVYNILLFRPTGSV